MSQGNRCGAGDKGVLVKRTNSRPRSGTVLPKRYSSSPKVPKTYRFLEGLDPHEPDSDQEFRSGTRGEVPSRGPVPTWREVPQETPVRTQRVTGPESPRSGVRNMTRIRPPVPRHRRSMNLERPVSRGPRRGYPVTGKRWRVDSRVTDHCK